MHLHTPYLLFGLKLLTDFKHSMLKVGELGTEIFDQGDKLWSQNKSKKPKEDGEKKRRSVLSLQIHVSQRDFVNSLERWINNLCLCIFGEYLSCFLLLQPIFNLLEGYL